ncbi:MAG: Lrp/AsnC family transcriptional regulator [Alphaproteobacteria bacterium]|nr:Lrp/AsnC family transcriptional regulator [Alphaproteobacteria bacterium]
MPDKHLEPVDRRILAALQADGRLTNQALAETVGLSASPCWRRVNRLEQDGFICGYRAELDRKSIGLGVLAFVRVRIDSHSEAEAEAFSDSVRRLREVVACYSVAGDADFLLQVVAPDLDSYADFAMNVIRRLPRIKEMQTTFVLKEIKPFEGYPIDAGRAAG